VLAYEQGKRGTLFKGRRVIVLCEKCHQRQAVVHMEQIINGQKTEMNLCHECVAQMQKPISFENFFQGLLDVIGAAPTSISPQKNIPATLCKSCGLSYEEFKKTGRLGCADCYQTFRRELDPVLKNIQGSNRHEGKDPQRSGAGLLNKRNVDKLKVALSKAIENEEFEEAARLRDQIRGLEALP
jgi:protein arginine kinase activator